MIAAFLGVRFGGLIYVWAKGDLEWLKRLPVERDDAPGTREAA